MEVDRFRGEVYIIFVLCTSWMAGPVVTHCSENPGVRGGKLWVRVAGTWGAMNLDGGMVPRWQAQRRGAPSWMAHSGRKYLYLKLCTDSKTYQNHQICTTYMHLRKLCE